MKAQTGQNLVVLTDQSQNETFQQHIVSSYQ